MTARRWSAKEDGLLCELYPQFIMGNVSRDELCGVLRRTWFAIHCRAGHLGLTNQIYDDIDEELLRILRKRQNKGG